MTRPPSHAVVPMLALSPRAPLESEWDVVPMPNPALAVDLKAVPRSPSAFSKVSRRARYPEVGMPVA
jgi:hypothetical protein